MLIKENHLYFFIIFWVYGFYGIGTDIDSHLKYLHILAPIFITPMVFIFNKNNEALFYIKKINKNFFRNNNVVFFFVIFVLLLFFSWEKISLSIASDEYAYSGLSLVHSNIIIQKILIYIDLIQDFKIKNLIHLISFTLILSFVIYFFIINSLFNNEKLKILFFLITIIILRFLIGYFGGNTFPHPPLIGLPGLLSVSFFGLSDFVLKMSHFLIYTIFAFFIFSKLRVKFHDLIALAIVLALFSIPGILYLGTTYEQSLWSMICFTIVLIEVQKKYIDYKKIFIIILFFSFFRILSLASVMILCLNILFKSKSINSLINESKLLLKNSYPLIILVPFLLFSFLDKSDLTINRLGFQFLEPNFFLFDLHRTIFDSYNYFAGFLIYIFFLIAFLDFKTNRLLITFVTMLIFIYSNVITLNSKYLYEIFFPFLVFGIIFFDFTFKSHIFNKIIITLIILLLPLNLILLKNFEYFCVNTKSHNIKQNFDNIKFGCKFNDNHTVALKKAYKFLKEQEDFDFKNLYVPGAYYGLLPSIINEMKLNDLKIHREINQKQNELNIKNRIDWTSADAKLINVDLRIRHVLIADTTNSLRLNEELINLGWKNIYNDIEKSFITKVDILRRID